MLPILLQLRDVNWKRVVGLGGAAVIVVLLIYVRLQDIALQHAQVVYRNPRVTSLVRTVRIQGPVRIVTRTVETPGRKETIVEEVREPVTEVHEASRTSEPVFEPAPRTDRWLVGLTLQPFYTQDRSGLAFYGGYSIHNRLDFCLGMSATGRMQSLIMVRF